MTPAPASKPRNPTRCVRVSICDRNRLSSQLLAESLGRNPQFEIAAVTGADEVLSSALARKPDLIVLSADFDGAKGKGFQLARSLSSHQPEIFIVVLVDANDKDSVVASFCCGATGVFCRTQPVSELWNCVKRVSQGEIWAGPAETQYLLQAVRNAPSWNGVDNDKVRSLAKREMEVAELASQGQSNRQIAAQLKLSEHTVKNYLFRVFEKLGVANRVELLFLLYNARDNGAGRPDLGHARSPFEIHLKAAEEGSATAQFMVGIAYLEGTGVDKNLNSAYCWLRMAQQSSSVLQRRSYSALEQLTAVLRPEELAAFDHNVEASLRKLGSSEVKKSTRPGKSHEELPALRAAG